MLIAEILGSLIIWKQHMFLSHPFVLCCLKAFLCHVSASSSSITEEICNLTNEEFVSKHAMNLCKAP